MYDYDRLPAELRAWIATADLPWRPKSVRKSFDRALSKTGNRKQALEELDRLQKRLLEKDIAKVWGATHPHAKQS